jgi:hypothetical protein
MAEAASHMAHRRKIERFISCSSFEGKKIEGKQVATVNG